MSCTSSVLDKNTCKVSKGLGKNCRRSCAHKVPTYMMDERKDTQTHGRTDGQTDGHGQRLMPFRILRIVGA